MYVGGRFVPDPCADSPTRMCSMEAIAPTSGNLLTQNAAGELEARLYVEAGNAISLTGDGTSVNPLRVSFEGAVSEASQLRGGDSWVTVTGSGSSRNPYIIKHNTPNTQVAGTYAGFTVDDAGHITGYTAPDFDGLRGVVGGDGITVISDPKTGIATISLSGSAVSDVSGTYQFGGYAVQLTNNRIDRVERNITTPAGIYTVGDKLLSLNEFGSIVSIANAPVEPELEPEPDPLPTAYSRVFSTSGESIREMRFVTDKRSAFRISYQSDAIPAGTRMFLDGSEITKYAIGTLRYEALTPTDYGEGEHVVSLMTQSDGGFLSTGIIDVILVGIGY